MSLRGGQILRRKAFSIIELLVAVAVVAVFASILFPVFYQALQAQRKLDNSVNLRKISRAAEAYSQDADGYIVIIANGKLRNLKNTADGVLTTYGEGRTDQWPLILLPYVGDRKVYV